MLGGGLRLSYGLHVLRVAVVRVLEVDAIVRGGHVDGLVPHAGRLVEAV